MNKIGLVFSGGGAKGAYQVGVWQALIDLGIDCKITGVSGTSIGAINGVLFAQGDICVAYEIWEKAKMDPPDIQKAKRLQKALIKLIGEGNYKAVYNITKSECLSSKYLNENITNHLKTDLLSTFPGDCFITGHDKKSKCPKYFNLKEYPKEEQIKIIQASAAIPYIFSSVKIEGKSYSDGGLSDNTPILPLYQAGYNPIIVVYLSRHDFHNVKDYPNCKIINLYPSQSLGNFKTGTLNFDSSKINNSMRLGYFDTINAIRYLKSFQALLPYSNVTSFRNIG